MILTSDGLRVTPPALRPVEEEMLTATGGRDMMWCGRATTALYWIYRAAAEDQDGPAPPEVIMPAIACAAPANAALCAGLIPRFAEADPATGMMTLKTVQARWTPRTRAVLFVDLFGQTTDLASLSTWCREKNIILIEDIAQALGAHLPDGHAAGSSADSSVFSFNATKILDCGGGALLVRRGDLAERLQRMLTGYQPPPSLPRAKLASLAADYRHLHHSLVARKRLHPEEDISTPFLQVRAAYDDMYLRPLDDPTAIAAAWRQLPPVLEQRARKAELYEQSLTEEQAWTLLGGWRDSGVCWRYTLLYHAPSRVVALSEAVRSDGFHVSNLYWDLSHFFRPDDVCPQAERFARGVVNLWVDGQMDVDSIRRCCRSLKDHATRMAGETACV